jgi:glycosyltransferase involved in cell wall biosynthesis
VTTSILNLADALREHLGAEVAYSYSVSHEKSNNTTVLEQIRSRLEVIPFTDSTEFDNQLERLKFDYFYSQKTGRIEKSFSRSIPNLNHAVFQVYEPHGHRYAYISETLAEQVRTKTKLKRAQALVSATGSILSHMRKGSDFTYTLDALKQVGLCQNALSFDFVPLPVPNHTEFTQTLRQELGIPESGFVLGSLSGFSEFNLQFVHVAIEQMLESNLTTYFLGPNMPAFTSHPRALFLSPITSQDRKRAYLNTLDVFVHARLRGESFGLGIAEAMAAGRPVVAWSGGVDKNHIRLVGSSGGLYKDKAEFIEKVLMFRDDPPKLADQIAAVSEFTPPKVAERFNEVFIR